MGQWRGQPWSSADATDYIRLLGRDPNLDLIRTQHAHEQMRDRSLIMSDVLFVLKNGFVYAEAQASTQTSLFKYLIESRSPNSGSRTVRLVVIPDPRETCIKVVTVMWVDE